MYAGGDEYPDPGLPPALQRMVEIRRDIDRGLIPVPAELWVATAQA